MDRTVKQLCATLVAFMLLIPAANVLAENPGNPTGGEFAKKHPRRNEVNNRVKNERKRINQGVKDGTLTPEQAQQLRANDRAIKKQEHAEVKANGGHITKAQKKQLNQELNANSQLIHDEKNPAK
ncbi:MAG TPA: hypothetical protein VK564_03450 [Thermodesulfobacteriota bacterium]|nr:hypothetical protein [Thermodesulfobacteriota bacterium]